MRIGIDARLWNETGVGRYIKNLVKNLAEIDKKNKYILFFLKKEYEEVKLSGENFEKKLANIHWHTLKEQILFPQILAREQLDLVHFPYFSLPFMYTGKFIMTIHDLILHHFSTGKASTLPPFIYYAKVLGYTFLLNQSAKRSEKIITVSHATEREIIDHLHISKDRIAVTYEGFDDNVQSIEDTNTKYVTQNTKYFLYVGNAYPHKNLERLLMAFTHVYRENKDVKLILIGKKDYFYDIVQKEIDLSHLQNAIKIVSDVDDTSLAYLYTHAIALVMPSLMEGFGLPALEAMAMQCPVIASKTPALEEICRDGALYCDPFNSKDIAEKMIYVLGNQASLAKNVTVGYKRAQDFSWRKMAQETMKIYESCIGV